MREHLLKRAAIAARLDAHLSAAEKRILDAMEPLEGPEAHDRLELQAQKALRVLLDNGYHYEPDKWSGYISATRYRDIGEFRVALVDPWRPYRVLQYTPAQTTARYR